MTFATWTYLGPSTPLKHFLEDIIVFFSCFFRGYVHDSTNRRYSPSFGGIRRYRKNHFSRAPKNTPKTQLWGHFGVTLCHFGSLWGGLDVLNSSFHDFSLQTMKNTPKTHFSLDSMPNHEKTTKTHFRRHFQGS